MKTIWLIVNTASGNYDATKVDALKSAFAAGGWPVDRLVSLPNDSLPTAEDARSAAPDLIAIYTGDGTVSALVDLLPGWDGPLLVLPGGTMNLLARKLHGENDAQSIVEKAIADDINTIRFTQAEGCGQHSLVGVIAGPTTAWGEVREDMRNIDLPSLTRSVPAALSQTFGDELVSVKGTEGAYQAIFIEPRADALAAIGIKAASVTDLAQHGFAWLARDFLGGPSDPLTTAETITVTGPESIGLLVDGERATATPPFTFTLRRCPINFVTTLGAAQA
jgi:hypothetical protein